MRKLVLQSKKTINIQKDQATPSREGGMVGRRWSHSDALPRHNATATRPNR